MTVRYFEDYLIGTTSEYGPIQVDEAQVVGFAEQFDPQPFHVDREAAQSGPFGRAHRQRLAYLRVDDAPARPAIPVRRL